MKILNTAQFKKEGYSFDVARDCTMALEKINHRIPDLVVLDIDFGPGKMNGCEFLKILREDDKTKSLKVVVMSNFAEKDFPQDISGLGVSKAFVKVETTPEEMVATIKDLLK